jgi:hypothetical protein
VLEFNASVLRRESPVGLGVLFIALSLPSGNLLVVDAVFDFIRFFLPIAEVGLAQPTWYRLGRSP